MPGQDIDIPESVETNLFLSTGVLSDEFKEYIRKHKDAVRYTLEGFEAAFNTDEISGEAYVFIDEDDPPEEMICPRCGSNKVLTPTWVNHNDGEVKYHDNAGLEGLREYCEDCKNPIHAISTKEYSDKECPASAWPGLPMSANHYDNDYSEKMLFEYWLAGPDGAGFCIFPLWGVHTQYDIDSMRKKIKNDRDVVGAIKVQWVKEYKFNVEIPSLS